MGCRPPISSASPRAFIESIARSREATSEAISNVRIDTDGEVAHVWFDYTFMTGDYKNAWGKEGWQLVRTGTGWKTAAVTWSAKENPIPRWCRPPASRPVSGGAQSRASMTSKAAGIAPRKARVACTRSRMSRPFVASIAARRPGRASWVCGLR